MKALAAAAGLRSREPIAISPKSSASCRAGARRDAPSPRRHSRRDRRAFIRISDGGDAEARLAAGEVFPLRAPLLLRESGEGGAKRRMGCGKQVWLVQARGDGHAIQATVAVQRATPQPALGAPLPSKARGFAQQFEMCESRSSSTVERGAIASKTTVDRRAMAPDGVWPAHESRSGGRSGFAQRRPNAFDDDRQSADDQIIRKSKNAKSLASQPRVPLGVPRLPFRRLAPSAVRLDEDLPCEANEIREIGSNRHLPAEAAPRDLMIANRMPSMVSARVIF